MKKLLRAAPASAASEWVCVCVNLCCSGAHCSSSSGGQTLTVTLDASGLYQGSHLHSGGWSLETLPTVDFCLMDLIRTRNRRLLWESWLAPSALITAAVTVEHQRSFISFWPPPLKSQSKKMLAALGCLELALLAQACQWVSRIKLAARTTN